MTKLSFKDYYKLSKQQLVEAAKQTPSVVNNYNVRSYCKLPLLNDNSEEVMITLKPKQKVLVNWLYEDINNPTCVSISFDGVKELESYISFKTNWKTKKMIEWLNKNTNKLD